MKIELTYEERISWFFEKYYESGMEYQTLLVTLKNEDLDNFKWYNDTISIPKYKMEKELIELLEKLVKENPNDMDLGKSVRNLVINKDLNNIKETHDKN